VSKLFIQEAVMETIRKTGRLVVDVDLTGRPVSPTSSDFPEADFGWMDDDIQKGYQAAVSSLVCERWGGTCRNFKPNKPSISRPCKTCRSNW